MEKTINYTYILRCNDDTLYCGWTNDLEARVATHNEGKGAKYTKARLPVILVYFEEFESKSQAMIRENQIKKLPRIEKMALFQRKKC